MLGVSRPFVPFFPIARMLALLREISLRHWLRSPVRSLLVVLGIALSVALYVAT
jgi:hypothetical protein